MPVKHYLFKAVFVFFSISAAFCQERQLDSVKMLIADGAYEQALAKLGDIQLTSLTDFEQGRYEFLLAKCYDSKGEDKIALEHYLSAKKKFTSADSIERAMATNLDIAFLIGSQQKQISSYQNYINEYFRYTESKGKDDMKAKGYISMAIYQMNQGNFDEARKLLKNAIDANKKFNNKHIEAEAYNNLAILYNEAFQKPDSALYYLNKNLDYIKKKNDNDLLFNNYANQAAAYYYLADYPKAISLLLSADSLDIKESVIRNKSLLYDFLRINYDKTGNYAKAYKYLELSKQYSDSLNDTKQNIAINDIHTKYKTKERELENTLLKTKVRTGNILKYTFLGLLVASLVIGFLILKNARRKEKILQQEKQIEQQKLEKALKEYELSSIDLMLESQEKERQRIANDLHDNLGSMLATLKLNFEHLKMRKNDLKGDENKLYDKTDELIAEAYQKVRRMAHAKNAGVFANEGLIPALKKLGKKISIPNKLEIDVQAYGFNQRLDNNLEIAIFRVAQELATNIIKHSQATEASIHLTHHEDVINLIIEDNGTGFNTDKLNTADGMGLQTIKKKIEQMGGSFVIDSNKGKGTTIIIDLPI